jgi:predicted metal-dependent TIM-barrel fold hydrolase
MTREIKDAPVSVTTMATAKDKWAAYDTPMKAKKQLRSEILALLSEFELGCPQLVVSSVDLDRVENYIGRSQLVGVDVTVEVR